MIDMKRPKLKKEDKVKEIPNDYPYGLRICLERQELDKLDLDVEKLKIGQKCTITAQAEITAVNYSERKGGPDDKNVYIQIQKLEIKDGPKSLYGEYLKYKNASTSGKLEE